MDWFSASGISNLAKSAVSSAQKSIDKVLDIKDEPADDATLFTVTPIQLNSTSDSKSARKAPSRGLDSSNRKSNSKSKKILKQEVNSEKIEGDNFFDEILNANKTQAHSKNKVKVESLAKNSFISSSAREVSEPKKKTSVKQDVLNKEHKAVIKNVKTKDNDRNEQKNLSNELGEPTFDNEVSKDIEKENNLGLFVEEKKFTVDEGDKLRNDESILESNHRMVSILWSNQDKVDRCANIIDDKPLSNEKTDDSKEEVMPSSDDKVIMESISQCLEPSIISFGEPENNVENEIENRNEENFSSSVNDSSVSNESVSVPEMPVEGEISATEDLDVSNQENIVAESKSDGNNDDEMKNVNNSHQDNHDSSSISNCNNIDVDCCAKDVENGDLSVHETTRISQEEDGILSMDKSQSSGPSLIENAGHDKNSKTEAQQEILHLKEIVEAREAKMIDLSKENILLQEVISSLGRQLCCSDNIIQKCENDIIGIKEELSIRISEMNQNLSEAIVDRDDLKCQLQEAEDRLSKSSDQLVANFTSTLAEKEKIIADLLEEGEALSKRELKMSNAAKKWKAKVRDLEAKNEQYQSRNEVAEAEVVKFKGYIKEKEEKENILHDQVKKLEVITDQQEDEISKLKDQLDDAEDKLKGMQTSLDCGHMEINRLNLEKVNMQSEMEEIASVKQAREELSQKIFEVEEIARIEREQSVLKIDDLRSEITRIEQTSTRREENLKLEINDLQHRLEEAESRNQELSQSIGAASRPLLRQIENLQNSHHNQIRNWEKVEKQLNDALTSCQQQLALSVDKERSAVEVALEMKKKIALYETQVNSLKVKNKELANEIVKEKDTVHDLEDSLKREEGKLETLERNHKKALNELQNEKMLIEDQLNAERLRREMEKPSDISIERNPHGRRASDVAVKPGGELSQNDEILITSSSSLRSRTSSTSSSSQIADSSNRSATTAVMEQLQTSLRQKEGEMQVLRDEILALHKTRASLAQELVTLSNHVSELEEKCNDSEELKQKNQDLESRYNAVLQMYGEKAEEVEELKMDLDDVKQMYKQQIQQLLDR